MFTPAYQSNHKNPERSLFHHSLICMLVKHHLAKMGDNWDYVLAQNGYDNPLLFTPTQSSITMPPDPSHIGSNALLVDEC